MTYVLSATPVDSSTCSTAARMSSTESRERRRREKWESLALASSGGISGCCATSQCFRVPGAFQLGTRGACSTGSGAWSYQGATVAGTWGACVPM
jgi:hypothetical protein